MVHPATPFKSILDGEQGIVRRLRVLRLAGDFCRAAVVPD
jgi:hypothetical protein